jgi:hypothetical protein
LAEIVLPENATPLTPPGVAELHSYGVPTNGVARELQLLHTAHVHKDNAVGSVVVNAIIADGERADAPVEKADPRAAVGLKRILSDHGIFEGAGVYKTDAVGHGAAQLIAENSQVAQIRRADALDRWAHHRRDDVPFDRDVLGSAHADVDLDRCRACTVIDREPLSRSANLHAVGLNNESAR